MRKKIVFFTLFINIILCGLISKSYAFEIGVTTHLIDYDKPTSYYLELMKKTGLNSIRIAYPWNYVESEKNVFSPQDWLNPNILAIKDGASKYGISSLVILQGSNSLYTKTRDYPRTPEQIEAFARYAYWVASEYKGKIKYYEVWNEWLYGTGNMMKPLDVPPPSVFYELVKQTYIAVKKADPAAIVMTGSFSPMNDKSKAWFDELIKLGILDYTDGVSLHPYGYLSDDSTITTPQGNLEAIDKYHEYIKQESGKDVPFYITEIGIPNYPGRGGVGVNTAAQYIVKYSLLAKTKPYIKGIWWYDLRNDGTNKSVNEHNFGLYDIHDKAKPAALALIKVSDIIKNYAVVNYKEHPDGRVKISLSDKDKHALIYWQQDKNEYSQHRSILRKLSANVSDADSVFMTTEDSKQNQSIETNKNNSSPTLIESNSKIQDPW